MKPELLKAVTTSNIGLIPKNNLIAYTESGEKLLFIDSELNYDDLKILIDNNDGILSHIVDKSLHWTAADRREFNDNKEILATHIRDEVIHVTQTDKNNWNSKETEGGSTAKANAVIELLEIHANDLDVHVNKLEKDRWNNTYTREQIANLIASAKSDTDWKDAVESYDDLYTTYPDAKAGWICTVLNRNTTYIFADNVLDDMDEGDEPVYKSMWIVAFKNSVPMATEANGGQISKEMYIKISNIEENANNYIHPDNTNCRHVTDGEKKIWSNKASKDLATIFQPGLLSSSDKEKLDTVEKYANFYQHPDMHEPNDIQQDSTHRFVTDEQIKTWNDKPTGKVATEENDGQMSKEDYLKLFNIEEKANHYVHPAKHSSSDIAQDTNNRFVSDYQIADWNNKETKLESQYRADKALEYAKDYTNSSIKTLVGSAPEVLNTLEELSKALGDDKDFAANVTMSLSNKIDIEIYNSHITDYNTHMTASDRAKFDTMAENANYYIHPETHPASMIVSDSNNRFITDVERSEWNSKANGNIASESLPGQMSPEMVIKLNSITTTGMIMSDWNETDPDSGAFIRNKPTALPAHGGNSETVNSYSALELVNSRKSSTIVIGSSSSGFTEKDVDLLCTGGNDSLTIQRAFEYIKEIGGSILLREGIYLIDTPLLLNQSNVILKGSGGTVLECGFSTNDPILYLNGDHCSIRNIYFNGKTNNLQTNLKITGNYNNTEYCTFNMGHAVNVASGSYNNISFNNLNKGERGIYCSILNEASFGNKINSNTILDYAIGVNIYSTLAKTNSNNIISNNTIYNCYSGIKLTNELQAHNTINNIITNNNIMRGTGLPTDYLYEQHTIRIEKGAFNIVSNNVLRGRAAVDEGQNNIISNNISV